MSNALTHIDNKPSLRASHCEDEGRRNLKQSHPLVPALRFNEFEGEWNEITLRQLFTFKNGLNSDKEKYGSGVKFINVLDIIGNEAITYDSIIGKVEVTYKELEKNEVIYGDVLFQRSSETREEVGQANIYVDKINSAVFGGFVIRGRKKQDYDPYFINYLLKTSPARKEITTKSGGSTRYNVGQESLSQVFVNLTTLPEQQKIASFLSAVDEKIQQLTKKKALLEQYKKGVMQQLFSGQLRFKGYSDKWQKIVFTECCDLIHGFQFREEHFESTGLAVIKIGSLVDNGSISFHNATYVSKDCEKTHSKFILKKGDVLMALTGGTLGKVSRIDSDYGVIFQNYRVGKFENKSNSSKEYIYFLLQSRLVQNRVKSLVNEAAQPNFGKQDFDKIRFELPSLEEQQKIATYISSIDTKIESVTTQITQTQTFKKGLLQQMFV
jgi:type I restriction enzyme S subunit